MEIQKDDYNLTMFEACEKLGKSKKTLSRYVRRKLIRPILVKSIKGTPEYRFSEAELQAFKDGQPRQEIPFDSIMARQEGQIANTFETINESAETRQETKPETGRQDKINIKDNAQELKEKIEETRQESKAETGKMEQTRQDETTNLIAETIKALTEQLRKKDNQLEAKDKQIDSLLERNREMNLLLKFLQDKYPALEAPKQRRGRKNKIQAAEAVGEEIQPEAPPEDQEPREAPRPSREKEEESAGQQRAAEEAEIPKEEEPKTEEKPKKKGFWKKLFTPVNLP
jgi:Helix-turn-helix domain